MRLEQHLRAILQRNLFCCVDIAHGEEAQPCRLSMLARRYILVNQSCDRTTVEKCLGVLCPAGLNVAKCPAKQPRIELLGGGEVRRHQFNKYNFADVMLLAGGLNNRRQLDRCGHDRHSTRNAEKHGEQPLPKKMSGSIRLHPLRTDLIWCIKSIRFELRCGCIVVSTLCSLLVDRRRILTRHRYSIDPLNITDSNKTTYLELQMKHALTPMLVII